MIDLAIVRLRMFDGTPFFGGGGRGEGRGRGVNRGQEVAPKQRGP